LAERAGRPCAASRPQRWRASPGRAMGCQFHRPPSADQLFQRRWCFCPSESPRGMRRHRRPLPHSPWPYRPMRFKSARPLPRRPASCFAPSLPPFFFARLLVLAHLRQNQAISSALRRPQRPCSSATSASQLGNPLWPWRRRGLRPADCSISRPLPHMPKNPRGSAEAFVDLRPRPHKPPGSHSLSSVDHDHLDPLLGCLRPATASTFHTPRITAAHGLPP